MNEFTLQQQRSDGVQRRWSGSVRKVTVFVSQNLANDVSVGHVRFQQRNEEVVLLRARFERLQDDVQHTIRVQIETA